MINIVVADDHTIIREGIRQIMARTPDIKVTGEASSGSELRATLLHSSFDVILVDLNMPDVVGYELVALLAKENPSTPIVVLSFHDEGSVVSQAIKSGATGYVTKGSSPDVLVESIRKAANGMKHVDPAVVGALVSDAWNIDTEDPQRILSARELQILSMFASGKNVGDIADSLFLSPKTISTHKTNMMIKLQITNNADLIRYAAKHKMA